MGGVVTKTKNAFSASGNRGDESPQEQRLVCGPKADVLRTPPEVFGSIDEPRTSGTKRSLSGPDDERPSKRLRTEPCAVSARVPCPSTEPVEAAAPRRESSAEGTRVVDVVEERPEVDGDSDDRTRTSDGEDADHYESDCASEGDKEEEDEEEDEEDTEEEEEDDGYLLPARPPPPFVGVVQRGPGRAYVCWCPGQPAVSADGTPVDTAAVYRYDVRVGCPEMDQDDWIQVGSAAGPGSPDSLIMCGVKSLPAGCQLCFEVVPIDGYCRAWPSAQITTCHRQRFDRNE